MSYTEEQARAELGKLLQSAQPMSIERYAATVALAALQVWDWSHGEECPAWANVDVVREQWADLRLPADHVDRVSECDCGVGAIQFALTGDLRILWCSGERDQRSTVHDVTWLRPDGEAMTVDEWRAAQASARPAALPDQLRL